MTPAAKPLAGIRIVEFDAIGPVPLAAMLLADLGAELIRIARPPASDAWDDVGGAVLHRGRDYVALDLKAREGQQAALALVARADALIEGFRPGTMERLGLGPEPCIQANPSLVYTRVTGWGQSGPLAQRAGHDINYIALTGALRAMGKPHEPPPVPLNYVGDYAGGTMFALAGLMAALFQARSIGIGQVIDVAMTDSVAALSGLFYGFRASGLWRDQRAANLLDGSAPYYRCYGCADGEYVAVGALEPQFFALLLDGLGISREDFVQADPACWPRMEEVFKRIFASKPRDYWGRLFADTDACVAPVLSFGEAAEHPHTVARGSIVRRDGVVQPAPAPRFSAMPLDIGERPAEVEAEEALARWN